MFLIEDDETFEDLRTPGDINLRAKCDLANEGDGISGLTGQGVEALITRITDTLGQRALASDSATRARHAAAMEDGALALRAAMTQLSAGESARDLAAEEIRTAIRALDSLVGRIGVEAVLDEIFSSFCLGK